MNDICLMAFVEKIIFPVFMRVLEQIHEKCD